jgi:translation initiation factor 3 subunit F
MWNYYRRATPSEQIVGWFITVRELTEGCQLYHNYYTALVSDISTKKELPPLVLLTMDVNFDAAGEKRLPVRAYTQ